MSLVYLNGEFKPIEEASVNVMDRGFIFGDGVYEVIPVFNRKIFRFDEHIKRLETSLAKIYMNNPLSKNDWHSIFDKLIDCTKELDQSIYLQVTRGISERDHDVSIADKPTIFAMSRPIRKNDFFSGIKAITHDDIRWQYCDIKAITLLPSVILRHKAKEMDAREAILIRDGFVTEGAASNIFIHMDNKIFTPPKTSHVLSGITRDLLVEILLENKIPLLEEPISENMLFNANEIWITSSTWEIVPIVKLNDKLIGSGRPGLIWKEVNSLYQEFKGTYCN
ncbi:MAG: D-amino acid aminotransferase [Legionellales bacterium]|nr:D-amino acid aminotransferase [Legionellales bacterium]